MAAISFGYPGGGTGTGFYRTQHFASYFLNDTGVDVYVSSVELSNVSTAVGSTTAQIALYNGDEIAPFALAGISTVNTSLTLGVNVFTISGDPICVPADQGVWVAFRCTSQLNLTPYFLSINHTVQGGGTSQESADAFPINWTMGGGYTDRVLPFVLKGDTVGPGDPTNLRAGYTFAETLDEGYSRVRADYAFAETLDEGYSRIRVDYVFSQPLCEGYSTVRCCLVFAQSLFPVSPEAFMSELPLPGFGNSTANPSIPEAKDPFNSKLPGLTFSVHKKPLFRTRISSAASGNEVRTPLMQYPIWEFELEYEFLEDRSGAESSLKTLLGFFLGRQGSYDSWLFKDPDDYLCDNHFCGTADATVLEFPFSRVMGEFRERVGQVDTANAVTVFLTVDEASAIPGSGPYTITVAHAADFIEDNGVTKGGVPMTRVSGSPAASQYSVAAGVYTFNSIDNGDAVVINYRYEIDSADYSVVMPNRLVFDSAPPAGDVSWSGQFFFVCRFTEDQQDYEKFMDKLWSLQTCEFRSIIQ